MSDLGFDAPWAGERAGVGLDAYRRSADVMRDTAKWIVSFVPGAGLIVTLAAVVPDLAKLPDDELIAPIIWLLVAALFATIGLVSAAWVLTATPPTWDWIVTTYGAERDQVARGGKVRPTALLRELDGEGFLRVYGYDATRDFIDAVNQRDPETMKAATGPLTTIVDFAFLRDVRRRFTVFLVAGTLAAVLAVGAVAAAQLVIARALDPTIDEPTRVELHPTSTGTRALEELGCTDVSQSVPAIAIAGALDNATVIATATGCAATSIGWDADRDGAIVPVVAD